MSNKITNTITNTVTNWVSKEFIMVDFPPQPWWDNDMFWQVIGAVAVPIVLALWAWLDNTRKEKESERKDELNLLLKIIDRNVRVLSSIHRTENSESFPHLLKYLRKEAKFLSDLKRVMDTMKYYNRSWILKNISALLVQTEQYRSQFSDRLIHDLEKNIATFIDHISSFLLQDKTHTKKDVKNLENILFNNDLKVRINTEIENINKGIKN